MVVVPYHLPHFHMSLPKWLGAFLRFNPRTTKPPSPQWENLAAAYALWFAYYNWCRVHSSLRVTPAMESGVADRIWTIAELIA